MEKLSLDEVHVDEPLWLSTEAGWSELHFEVGRPPFGRARGSLMLEELSRYEALRPQVARRLLSDILTNDQIRELGENGALNFFYTSADKESRFVVCLIQHQGVEATFHAVPRRS